VSDISGRGVGLDAVKRFLQEEGGDIDIVLDDKGDDIESKAFQLQITLPASHAIQVNL